MSARYRFVLVRGHEVVARVDAVDRADAMARFGWAPGDEGLVVSEASHRLGMPRALAAHRCTSCGTRDRLQPYEQCGPCRLRVRQDRARASEAARRAAKTEWERKKRERLRQAW